MAYTDPEKQPFNMENFDYFGTDNESPISYDGWFVRLHDDPLIKFSRSTRGTITSKKSQLVGKLDNVEIEIENVLGKNPISKKSHNLINGLFLKYDEVTAGDIIKIRQLPDVDKIIPLVTPRLILDVSVPMIGAPNIWMNMTDSNGAPVTGQGVKIGIIDSGVDYTHPDLGGSEPGQYNDKVVGGYDFIYGTSDCMDIHYHGTHVSSTAAGNGLMVGVAPDAMIYGYRVCDAAGYCYNEPIINALEEAVEQNLDVVNMSIGGPGYPDQDIKVEVINNIVENTNMVIVISAGNSGPTGKTDCWLYGHGESHTICCPACGEGSIAVAASDDNDNIAGFSSRGPTWPLADGSTIEKPDISAPGVNICAAISSLIDLTDSPQYQCNNDLYHAALNGTSMAAPHVTGAVALLKQLYPDITSEQVKSVFRTGAVDIGLPYYTQGDGRLDLSILTTAGGEGCTDPDACNYNPIVETDDGSCEYIQPYRRCNGECLNDVDGDDICDEEDTHVTIYGCTDTEAINYDSNATDDDGSCIHLSDLPSPTGTSPVTHTDNNPGNVFDYTWGYSQPTYSSIFQDFYSIRNVTINDNLIPAPQNPHDTQLYIGVFCSRNNGVPHYWPWGHQVNTTNVFSWEHPIYYDVDQSVDPTSWWDTDEDSDVWCYAPDMNQESCEAEPSCIWDSEQQLCIEWGSTYRNINVIGWYA